MALTSENYFFKEDPLFGRRTSGVIASKERAASAAAEYNKVTEEIAASEARRAERFASGLGGIGIGVRHPEDLDLLSVVSTETQIPAAMADFAQELVAQETALDDVA